MIKVGVFGAGGRMGLTVCQAVCDDPELELVAAVDPHHVGIDVRQLGVRGATIQVARTADALAEAGADVAVDFTVIDAARENLAWCASTTCTRWSAPPASPARISSVCGPSSTRRPPTR